MHRHGFIDSLRGLAAMYVVVFHMALVPQNAPEIPDFIRSFVMLGGSGVTLFFVVSAFSLCLTMERHRAHRAPLLSYALSRAFRILPLFYATLGFMVWFYAWLGGPVTTGALLLNLSTLFNLVPGQETGIVWASWTVGVEVLFYVAFPFLYARLLDLRSKVVGLVASILLAMAFTQFTAALIQDAAIRAQFEIFSVFTRAPCFFIGMIAYEVCRQRAARTKIRRTGVMQIAAGLLLLGICAEISAALDIPSASMTSVYLSYVIAAGYAALLLGLAIFPWRVLVNRVSRFWGTCSYSVYLWHVPIIWSSSGIYLWINNNCGPFAFCAAAVLTISALSLVGWVSFRLIEAPGIRLGRAALRKLDRRPVAELVLPAGP